MFDHVEHRGDAVGGDPLVGSETRRCTEVLLELSIEGGGELVESVVDVGVVRPDMVAEHPGPRTDVDDRARTLRPSRCDDDVESDPMPERVSRRVDEIELLAFERRHRRARHVVEVLGRHETSVSGDHDEYG